jgi:pilus assembly protein CpaC
MTDARVSGQQRKSSGVARIAPRRLGAYGRTGNFRAVGAAAAIDVGLLWIVSPALAEKAGPCHAIKQQVSEIKVTLYKSRTLCFSGPFSTAVIGAPEIADVLPITESMLYVQGKKGRRDEHIRI